MAVPTKTDAVELLAWADTATGAARIGTAVDVATRFAATVFVQLARRSGTAFTAGWPNVRIEAAPYGSRPDQWVPLTVLSPEVGASIANTTLNGAVLAGATSCTVTAATNIAVGDLLYLGDTSSANWEIVRVRAISGSTVTFEEACQFAHANAAAVTDQATRWAVTLDLGSITRIRVVVDNANGGQTVAVGAWMSRLDSIG